MGHVHLGYDIFGARTVPVSSPPYFHIDEKHR